jgi:hypothetical protein
MKFNYFEGKVILYIDKYKSLMHVYYLKRFLLMINQQGADKHLLTKILNKLCLPYVYHKRNKRK